MNPNNLTGLPPEEWLWEIWKHQRLLLPLKSVDGRLIEVIDPGKLNYGEGPDFIGARIRVDNILLAGNVEIHTTEREWMKHGHNRHPAYKSVILHVVYRCMNRNLAAEEFMNVPVLELEPYISDNFKTLLTSACKQEKTVICADLLSAEPPVVRLNLIERMAHERLEEKAKQVYATLQNSDNNWLEALWQETARALGAPYNSEPMYEVAGMVRYRYISAYLSRLKKRTLMLLGAAGFTELFDKQLYEDWLVIKARYGWNNPLPLQWKVGGVRPASHPANRLIQLAVLAPYLPAIWQALTAGLDKEAVSIIREIRTDANIRKEVNRVLAGIRVNKGFSPVPGTNQIYLLVINAWAPLLIVYYQQVGRGSAIARVLNLLERIPPENNRWTRVWTKEVGVKLGSALHTQGVLQLLVKYCSLKKCHICVYGQRFFRGSRQL